MMERHCIQSFVLGILFATVRGLNTTQCLTRYNDSYTCPQLSDPPERTHCCLLNNQPGCCLPGGSSCSHSADKRNYCPRPDDGKERTHCCIWDSQSTCCLPGGSWCSDKYADIRNYCPGPNSEENERDWCVWAGPNGQDCCRDKFTGLYVILGLMIGGPVVGFCVIFVVDRLREWLRC
ncbi:hypothetical protein ACROYT_G007601 [Oculina patagonica]